MHSPVRPSHRPRPLQLTNMSHSTSHLPVNKFLVHGKQSAPAPAKPSGHDTADRMRRCASSGSPNGPESQWLPFLKKALETLSPTLEHVPVCRNTLQHVSSSANEGRPVVSTRNACDSRRDRALFSSTSAGLEAEAHEWVCRAGLFSCVLLPPGRLCAIPGIASCGASLGCRPRALSACSSIGTTRRELAPAGPVRAPPEATTAG
jgi:hypothetical protein